MRVCPFDGCPKVIPPDKFACPRHWFSLNDRQRARIWGAYRAYTRGTLDVQGLRKFQQEVLDEAQGRTVP
jgi:hypothetical protein